VRSGFLLCVFAPSKNLSSFVSNSRDTHSSLVLVEVLKAKGERKGHNLYLQDLYELLLRNDGGFVAIFNLQQLWITADY
jgi:hypothetical protein